MRKHTRVGMLAAIGLVYLILPAGANAQPAQAKRDVHQASPSADGQGKQVPTVQVIHPAVRHIVRVIGRACFIESYERTAIRSKIAGYVEKWNVDIGDRVKKGDVLATLFAPEVLEDHETKNAAVKLERERIGLALDVVTVAEADVQAAQARVKEARSILAKYEAEVERWNSEAKRLKREVDRKVVDPQVMQESTNQLKSSTAARDAAKAAVENTEAELLAKQAALAKGKRDVKVADAALTVARSEENRLKAWISYLRLTAPFDGVIVARNANTFDFVQPAVGAAPIYVVDRTDIVRIFVDIPEQDANYVDVGTKASVVAKAYRDRPIPATITRTSWALNFKTRTLRAEIDLPNPGSQLLPGMYAYVKVVIERPAARALPVGAIIKSGDKTCCWTYANGHAVPTEIETGANDGEWIEVVTRRVPTSHGEPTGDETWMPIDGSEQVIVGNLSMLADGAAVRVGPPTNKAEAASTTPGRRLANPVSAPGEGRADHHGAAASSGPDQVEAGGTEAATLALDQLRVDLALEIVKVAEAGLQAAETRLNGAHLMLTNYQADADRWTSDVTRLKREVDRGVVDAQVLRESTNQLKASTAARDAAKAGIETAEAELRLKKATLSKAMVDVKVARAELVLARSEKGHEGHLDAHHEEGRGPHRSPRGGAAQD